MKYILTLIILFPSLVFGQLNNIQGVISSSFDKANNLYDLGFYNESIQYFEEGLLVESSNQNSIERLATSYMKIGDYKNSWSHYLVLFDLTAVKDIEIIKNFAEVSLATGDLANASYWFTKASQLDGMNEVYNNRLQGVHDYNNFYTDSALVKINGIALNTEHAEFGLRPFNKGIALVSSESKDLVIQNNYLRGAESFTNLYRYQGVSIKSDSSRKLIKLKNHLSSNDGPISQSDRFIAVSRNIGKSKKNVKNTLGIFFYTIEEGEMEFDSEFPHNGKSYSTTHPWLNPHGDTLYFASNMKGNYGGFDIYYSIYTDYKWSTPVNLGENINTSANEIFPMMDYGNLYFSSNGHKGLGGLDNYKVNLKDPALEVINLGYPLNSGYDDMSIYIELDSGFFASNRLGGKGMDDIYQFKINPAPEATVKITVKDKLNEEPIEEAKVSFKTYTDSLSLLTENDGVASTIVTPNNFIFNITKKGYEHASFPTIIHNGDEFVKTLFLEPIIDLEIIAPDSIMFHLGKFELKEIAEEELLLIVESMEKYPHLKLLIAAHTDSRGKAGYNQTLSEKRADETFNYLVKLGIAPDRITKSGFGESRLLNNCKDGVKCSEEEHAANRRIEFFLSVEFEEENIEDVDKLKNN